MVLFPCKSKVCKSANTCPSLTFGLVPQAVPGFPLCLSLRNHAKPNKELLAMVLSRWDLLQSMIWTQLITIWTTSCWMRVSDSLFTLQSVILTFKVSAGLPIISQLMDFRVDRTSRVLWALSPSALYPTCILPSCILKLLVTADTHA